jgi:hypothetical protein
MGHVRPMALACGPTQWEEQSAGRPMPTGARRSVTARSPRTTAARWRGRCGSPMASRTTRLTGRASPSCWLAAGLGSGSGDSPIGRRDGEGQSGAIGVVLTGGGALR